jgi:predicted dehydrogenase
VTAGRPTRWGVIGPGGIADRFAAAMTMVEEGEIVAVASRSLDRADAYADRHGVSARYDDRAALLADPDVDVVYVATPHAQHEADTLAALAAGKHVLCEKAFALDADQATRMVDAARSTDRFLMEALWSRFLPSYRRLRDLLDDGVIGEPLLVEADFGFRMPFDPGHRLFDPDKGGGALLDLGIYPVQLCSFVLGLPERVIADAVLGSTGVDEVVAGVLHHAGGRLGVVKASTRVPMACTARISGTDGWIDLPAFMHCPTSITVHAPSGVQQIDASFEGDGLRFEIDEVHRCLAAGETESPLMPLGESIALMRVLDDVRAQVGVSYDRS